MPMTPKNAQPPLRLVREYSALSRRAISRIGEFCVFRVVRAVGQGLNLPAPGLLLGLSFLHEGVMAGEIGDGLSAYERQVSLPSVSYM